jgi:hypothetical protein
MDAICAKQDKIGDGSSVDQLLTKANNGDESAYAEAATELRRILREVNLGIPGDIVDATERAAVGGAEVDPPRAVHRPTARRACAEGEEEAVNAYLNSTGGSAGSRTFSSRRARQF